MNQSSVLSCDPRKNYKNCKKSKTIKAVFLAKITNHKAVVQLSYALT